MTKVPRVRGLTFLSAVVLSLAGNAEGALLPTNLCRQLSQAPGEVFDLARKEFPNLKKENLRLMPEAMLLHYLDWSAKNNVSSLEIFSDELFRDPECVVYIKGESLWRANREFELFLLAPIVGVDTKKEVFYMTHFFGGMGHHAIIYNKPNIVFNHPVYQTKFEIDQYLRQKAPRFGRLELSGLRALVYVFFKERRYNIDSLTLLPNRRIEINAEGNKSKAALFSIQRRKRTQSPRKVFKFTLPGLSRPPHKTIPLSAR